IDATKSPNDTKQYRLLTLDNDLQVLLIQFQPGDDSPDDDYSADGSSDDDNDSEDEDGSEDDDGDESCSDDNDMDAGSRGRPSDVSMGSHPSKGKSSSRRAGACLTVGVGSFSEPQELGGLAHYLEHMLFMGSEKYPDENEFESFLSAHGGYSNGETDCERTSYLFEVGPDHLQHALDMFAQFFISPLMKADAMDRELCAIESEFNQATTSDQIRLQQVLATTADAHHPFQHFNWGNTKSLRDIPAARGIDVRARVRSFYDSHYSANLMKLVVCGQDSLDDMESWVRTSYSPIQNKQVPPPSFATLSQPFGRGVDASPMQCQIVPLKTIHAVSLLWCLPPLSGHNHLKPHDYVASIVGHESEGSILFLLKSVGWALSMSAGLTEDHGYDYGTFGSVFTIEIKLTAGGLAHVHDVVTVVFQFLTMMRASPLPAWIYDEAKAITELNFQFQEEQDAIAKCEELAAIMQVQRDFDAAIVHSTVLQHLTVDNLRLHIVSSSFADASAVTWKEEEWFGIKYVIEPIAPDVLARWSTCGVHPNLHYQAPNPFIPTDLSLIHVSDSQQNAPRRLPTDDGPPVWYHPGVPFRTPRAHVVCSVTNPTVIQSAKAMMASGLYLRLVKDALNAYAYQAQVAQLSFDVHIKDAGFELFACGFNDKLPQLVRVMVHTLVGLEFADSRFAVLKDELVRQYQNALLKVQAKAKFARLNVILDTSFSHQALLDEAVQFTAHDMRQFVSTELWQRGASVTGMVHGNMTAHKATDLIHQVAATIATVAAPAQNQWIPRLVRAIAPSSNTILWQKSDHDQDVNTIVEYYFQMTNHTIETMALTDLLQQIMEEPLFDSLRTKKQLGYEVSCTARETHGILGFGLAVVSSSASAAAIAVEMDAFLAEFRHTLANITADQFSQHVQSQVQLKREPDVTMMVATERFWTEISNQRLAFDLNRDVANWLESNRCTKETLEAFYSDWFGPTARKLQVHVVGQRSSSPNIPPPDGVTTPHAVAQFKALTTLPNGLQVLLIQCQSSDHSHVRGTSQPFDDDSQGDHSSSEKEDLVNARDSVQAAACLTVEVGSFADPPHLQGLAHYVEHMLFMGSAKYPDENAFESYLSLHGGYSNATTDCESTAFVFETNASGFEGALDMFAHFFVSPLLKKDAMDREFWGNQLSLRDSPAKGNVNVYEALRNFFRQYYTASHMKLVLCSPHDLDALEQWTARSFGAVPSSETAAPSYELHGSPFQALRSHLIKLIPLQDMHAMHMYFSLPPLVVLYKQKPAEYIRYILSHECNQSLLSTLTDAGWATAIVAGISDTDGYESGSYGCQFEVQLTLTIDGLDHWDEIAAHVFAYLNMLKQCPDLPEWIFSEFKASSELAFRFPDEMDPLVACKELSRRMQARYAMPPQDWLQATVFQGAFQQHLVKDLLSSFSAHSVRVVLVSTSFDIEVDDGMTPWNTEPWFGTSFTCDFINPGLVESWHQSHHSSHWPLPNPYIPTDIGYIATPATTTAAPFQVRPNLWVLPDLSYHTPRINACFNVALASVRRSLEAHACALLYCEVANDALRELKYFAQCADMDFDIGLQDGSDLEVVCYGYGQHLGAVVSQIFQTLARGDMDPTRFEAIRNVFVQNLHNKCGHPTDKSRYLRLLVLETTALFELEDICAAVEALTCDRLMSFVRDDMWVGVCFTAFFHGNIDDASADTIFRLAAHPLERLHPLCSPSSCTHRSEVWMPQALALPSSPLGRGVLVRQPSAHVDEVNTSVEIYYQLGKRDVRSNVYANLIQCIMQEPLYSSLRSRDQLGYDLSCCVRHTHGVLGFSVSLVSSAYSASHLAMRVDAFLHGEFPAHLAGLDDDTFERHVAARKVAWTGSRPSTLRAATAEFWAEITSQRLEFHSKSLFLDELNDVTKEECVRRFHDWFVNKPKKMRLSD
ncbi:hypothetical protein DYB35_000165, partial [Aphanomyces astaci]